MDYYELIKKKIYLRRIIPAVIAFVLGIVLIIMQIPDLKLYSQEPITIDMYDLEDRDIANFEGKFITINVKDILVYINREHGEYLGRKYGIFPANKSEWVVGYEGFTQYCTVLVSGKQYDEFADAFDKLVKFDNDEILEPPNVNIYITGRIVKRTGVWQQYLNEFAKYLYEEENVTYADGSKTYEDISDAAGIFGDYIIDATQAKPGLQIFLVIVGALLILWAVYILAIFITGKDRKKLEGYLKSFGKRYNKTLVCKDYRKGRVYGNTVVGERFIYYVKGMRNRIFRIQDINDIVRSDRIFTSKIKVTDVNGKKIKFRVPKKYGKKIMKNIVADLQEIEEFGIEE